MSKRAEIYDYQLTIDKIISWASENYPDQEIVYAPPNLPKMRLPYSKLYERVRRMASAIESLGIKAGDKDKWGTRIGVMDWNTNRYVELFYAIPITGAIMHTVNIRLSPEEMIYTINKSEDEILFVNDDFLPLLQSIISKLNSVKKNNINERKGQSRTNR